MKGTDECVLNVEREVRQRMDGLQAGHGMDHVLRVLSTARRIQAEVGGDKQIIELASLLHDVGDAKFHHGVERSAEFAREILSRLGVQRDRIELIAHIVDNISVRKGVAADPLTLEGQIIQDADRLDALGAVGIVRTIEYGAAVGQPFYAPDRSDGKTGVAHFHEKLFRLKGKLNTETARQIAEAREQFMHQFLAQYIQEYGETAP
ncbi:MAG: HD domain-containing protein [Planctomycetota bacterium]